MSYSVGISWQEFNEFLSASWCTWNLPHIITFSISHFHTSFHLLFVTCMLLFEWGKIIINYTLLASGNAQRRQVYIMFIYLMLSAFFVFISLFIPTSSVIVYFYFIFINLFGSVKYNLFHWHLLKFMFFDQSCMKKVSFLNFDNSVFWINHHLTVFFARAIKTNTHGSPGL